MGEEKRHHFGSISAEPSTRPTPFVKWAGGKGHLLGQMVGFIPEEWGLYLEPFLGGGAAFFRLLPETAVLGDLNPELMNVFRVIQNDVELLMRQLDRHGPRKSDEAYYYEVRKQRPEEMDPVSRAARALFLNKTCYNGLYRVNQKGEFNVPFGRYEKPQLYDSENLFACCRALRGKSLLTADYTKTLSYAHSGDLVYFDPPYEPVTETANFTSYTVESFGQEEQRKLADYFRILDKKGCILMLSNSATPLVHELYAEYYLVKLKGSRAISSKAGTRGPVEELLIMNYEP